MTYRGAGYLPQKFLESEINTNFGQYYLRALGAMKAMFQEMSQKKACKFNIKGKLECLDKLMK